MTDTSIVSGNTISIIPDDDISSSYLDAREEAGPQNAGDELLRQFSGGEETPEEVPAEAPEGGGVTVGDVASDVAEGLTEIPVQVVGGVRDATQETMNALDSLSGFIAKHSGIVDVENFIRRQFGGEPVTGEEQIVPNLPEVMDPDTVTGGLVRGVTQFITGFVGGGKALKLIAPASRGGKLAKSAAQGSIADVAVFGPHEERLSNLIEEFPALQNPVTEFLAADPEDSEAEGRFKNAIEGLALGVLTEGFFQSVRAIRGSREVRASQDEPVVEQVVDEAPERDFILLGDPDAPLITPVDKATAEGFHMESGLPAGEKTVNINLARINSSDDIKDAIDATARIFGDEIDEARRGVQSNEETAKLADAMGMTPEQLLKRRSGQAFNAEEALGARQILVSSGDQLVEFARKATQTNASEEDVLAFRHALAIHSAIQQQVSGVTAEAGRALQAFNIPAGGTATKQRAIRDLINASGGLDHSRRMAARLAALDDPSKVAKFAREGWAAKTTDVALQVWINALLSGPQTHAVNILSNSLVALWQIPERQLAAGIRNLTGGDGVIAGEAQTQAFGMIKGFGDGLVAAAKVLRTGDPSDPIGKIELRKQSAISAENLDVSGVPGRAVDVLGKVVSIPGRFLLAEDELFKSIGYRMELNAQALRVAKSEGLEGADLAQRIQGIKANPPENIKLAAIDAARYQTFTQPLGAVGQSVQRMVSNVPALRLIAPFIRTPTNIAKFAVARTPAGPLMKSVREDIAAGGARRDLALARISMGSMVMAASADLAMQGVISGGGPSDPALQAAMRNTGWQPYSIKIGDTWHSYSRLEPLGVLLGLSADASEIMGQLETDKERDNLAATLVMAVSKNITSKTYLRGLAETFEVISDPDRYGSRYVQRFAGTAVPTGVAQVARVQDPTLREARTVMDNIRSRIPGYSESLPPRRNLWGESIVLSGGLGPDIMSPIYTSKEKDSPIDEEIIRLRSGVRMPARNIDGVDLSTEEYSRYVELAGNELKDPSTGLGAKDTLDSLVTGGHASSDQYFSATDGPEGGKSLIIREIVLGFRQAARMAMREEFPDLDFAIQDQLIDSSQALTGEGSTTIK